MNHNFEGEDKNLMWEEVSTEHIVQDEWIDFRKTSFRFPDGKIFEPYYTYSRRDYVVIVASDEEGKYLCVRQFRQGIREVTTEFVAGGIERKDGMQFGDKGGHASDDSLEAALEAAINKEMKRFTPEVYQPSLFEAIMVKNTRDFMESGNEGLGPVHETIHEFTKWNIVKALKLESFSVDDVRKLANKYVNA